MNLGSTAPPHIAIVDYGLGNLFSVEQACRSVGLSAHVTHDRREIEAASAVILPGVGAFGDAMATLHRLDMVGVLRDYAASGRPLIGICLGIQLLMTRSYEFGTHEGLGLVRGEVRPLDGLHENGRRLKVPQVGWNTIQPVCSSVDEPWAGTLLQGLRGGDFMYFVHSYVVVPEDPSVTVSTTRYGNMEFCSSLQSGSVFACQFHPERSGAQGLRIYENLRRFVGSHNA